MGDQVRLFQVPSDGLLELLDGVARNGTTSHVCLPKCGEIGVISSATALYRVR